MTTLLQPDTVETSFHVRYAETDAMGIVHHSNYPIWFEEARSAFMRAYGTSYASFEADGVALAIAELTIRYLLPARYDQLITIRCRLEQIQSRKVIFSYTVLDAETGKTLATGITQQVCLNRQGQVVRIPAHWQDLLKKAILTNPQA